jgi:hypothetical protein
MRTAARGINGQDAGSRRKHVLLGLMLRYVDLADHDTEVLTAPTECAALFRPALVADL